MFRLTLKNLFARKLRALSTATAVLLGVAFIVGSLGLGNIINKTFDSVFDGVYEGVDVVVRGEEKTIELYEGFTERQSLDTAVVQRIEALPEVKRVERNYVVSARLVGSDGKVVGGGAGPPALGRNWTDEMNPFKISEGRVPQSDDEFVADAGTVDMANAKVGQTYTILTDKAPIQAKLVGVVKFGDLESAGGESDLLFTTARAISLNQDGDKPAEVTIAAKDADASDAVLRDKVRTAAANPALLIETAAKVAEDDSSELKKNLSFISMIPLIFGIISVVVAAFIINNTFAILLAQRTREMALLRAVGARRRQVLASVVFESFIIGLISSVLGIILGLFVAKGLAALLNKFVADFPSTGLPLTVQMVVVGLLVGVLVTMLAAFLPAWRASRVPPLAALRDVAVDKTSSSIVRAIFGLLALVLAVVTSVMAFNVEERQIVWVGLGSLFAVLAAYILGPFYARWLGSALGWLPAVIRGVPGSLARKNSVRNPRRAASTASALLIGVTLVTATFVFVSSFEAFIKKTVDRTVSGDFVLMQMTGEGTFDGAIAEQLKGKSELKSVVGFGALAVQLKLPNGSTANYPYATAVAPADAERLMDIKMTSGKFTDINGNAFGVTKKVAEDKGLKLGDSIQVLDNSGRSVAMKLGAIYDGTELLGPITLNKEFAKTAFGVDRDNMVLVAKKDDVSVPTATAAIESVTDPYVEVQVQDKAQLRKAITSQVNIFLNVILGLLSLAIIIALFGIANTLALAVFERKHEIGLLRAVGMSRSQTRSMIRWEAIVISLIGTVVGLLLGVLIGLMLVRSLKDEGFTELSVPYMSLLWVTIGAMVAGFIAAVLPARRAGRTDVLQAIASD